MIPTRWMWMLVVLAACQPAPRPSAIYSAGAEQEVLQAEHGWINATARQDADAFAGYLDDTWVGLTEGRVLEKAAWVNAMRGARKQNESVELSNLKVRFPRPDVAVVTGTFMNRTRAGTTQRINVGSYLDTWVRIGGRWQLVSSGFAITLKSP
jgi:hypothetical protein